MRQTRQDKTREKNEELRDKNEVLQMEGQRGGWRYGKEGN